MNIYEEYLLNFAYRFGKKNIFKGFIVVPFSIKINSLLQEVEPVLERVQDIDYLF